MQKPYINGIGQIKVAEHWDKSLREMAGEAALLALQDADFPPVDGLFIGNMMSPTANRQSNLGPLLADWLDLNFTEAVSVESACASGSSAFRNAVLAIASGQITTALVVGVEKMTDSPSSEITTSLASAADADLEVDMGVSFVALNALIMKRYMHEYGWNASDFAIFSINAHNNATANPYARFNKEITLQSFKTSPMVCDPINLLDASSIGDGAAAVVISCKPLEKSHSFVTVTGSASATDTISLQNRDVPTWLKAVELSARRAYSQAGISPAEIGVFEYHDAFSIMAALSLEACGFCDQGQAPKNANNGEIQIHGRIPVATRGGLKARGHPVGATGLYQIVEVTQQLRGECGTTQVENNTIGMAQNIGGSGSNVITHIIERQPLNR